jgi:hypothetical protein
MWMGPDSPPAIKFVAFGKLAFIQSIEAQPVALHK